MKDKPAPWTDDQKRWAGQVTHMDRSVGAILDELKVQGLDENTLVLFTSDNGYSAWGYTKASKKVRWKDDPVLKNKGPWDRGKLIAANGGVIVPFIAWGPGMVKTGETERAVSCYDLKATFAAMAGTTAAKTDGVSFLPLFAGDDSDVPQREFLYWEQGTLGRNVQSVLLDERFFALRMKPGEPVRVFEVFDDPGCKQDLASKRQDLVERAEKLFGSNRTENPWYPNLTSAIKKQQLAAKVRPNSSAQVKTDIDWPAFLARHDMIWKRLPGNWREAPWTGNGMIGSMSWVEKDALRLQVFRGDVQAHRPMTQGSISYTRARLQIGSFYLKPETKPVGCNLRLSLHDAEVSGSIQTMESDLNIRQFTHSKDMVIVTDLESGDAPVSLTWKPASSMPSRKGYATSERKLPRLRKKYRSNYPTKVFAPNPDPVVKVVDGVNVCIQDLLGGSRHVTAWKMVATGKGKQRLVVSIANRWPKKSNDPIAEAVAAVSKVCDMDADAYAAWKQKHYDWWHAYYPAGFVSVPDTGVETMYWTTMYKLGSATRADRAMIDTASIWQTPSIWADSHWDFNIPYCYYPIPTANRIELGDSLIRKSVIARDLPSHPEICASLTKRSTEAAISFIKKSKESPFFAYIPFNMPHLGLYAIEDFLGRSRRGLLGDVMAEIDDSVGRIRNAVEEAGLTKNTLIIFSSDNGPWITFQDTASHRKYGEARLHVGYAQPFRDGKGSTWEGGHRVPGIFCWPGTIPANSVEQSPVSTLDILPTVFALAGADLPKDRSIDGRDISPYLMPHTHKANVPAFEFYYSWKDNMPSALRIGPWKMHIRIASQTGNNYGFQASRDTPILFQVEQDLGERIDRAGEQPKRVEEMLEKLTAFESQVQEEGSFWTAASPQGGMGRTGAGSTPPDPGVSGPLPVESRGSLTDKQARNKRER